MSARSANQAYTLAILGGAILWITVALVSGRTEAWDSPLYGLVAYPLCIVLAGVLGYTYPERPWRFALAIMLVQPVLLAFSGSGFGLLPLGMILFAVLALPAIGAAQFTGWLARRHGKA